MSNHEHDDFDRRMRALHAHAVDRVPSRTVYELGVRRANAANAAPRPAHRSGWWLAAATATAVFALAIGLRQPGPATDIDDDALPPLAAVAGAVETIAYEDGLATLEEDPDLYLWLDAQDSLILAME